MSDVHLVTNYLSELIGFNYINEIVSNTEHVCIYIYIYIYQHTGTYIYQ